MTTESSTSGPERLPIAGIAPVMIEAVVQTAATETVYCRAGSGVQILLLSNGGANAPCGEVLFSRLAQHFRVIAPEAGARAAEESLSDAAGEPLAISAWLRAVIDGLGLTRPSIVADDAFAIAALGFALTDPDRVDRLVMVSRDAADPALAADAFADTLRHSGHSLLLLRLDPAADPAGAAPVLVAEMIRFLSAKTDDPPQARIPLSVDIVEPTR